MQASERFRGVVRRTVKSGKIRRLHKDATVKSITGILRYGPAGFINFTLWNWIEVVEVLEILSKSGQNLLSDCPSFQIVEPLRFETQFYSSFMH